MLMLRSTHERIMSDSLERAAQATSDALAERNAARADAWRYLHDLRTIGRALREKIDECDVLNESLGRVSTQLAKFTSPRKRDASGQFVSAKL